MLVFSFIWKSSVIHITFFPKAAIAYLGNYNSFLGLSLYQAKIYAAIQGKSNPLVYEHASNVWRKCLCGLGSPPARLSLPSLLCCFSCDVVLGPLSRHDRSWSELVTSHLFFLQVLCSLLGYTSQGDLLLSLKIFHKIETYN